MMYRIDRKLPASGYRNTERNAQLILFSMREDGDLPVLASGEDWHLNIAVDRSSLSYNAEVRRKVWTPLLGTKPYSWETVPVEIPSEAIVALVGVAMDPEFMNLSDKDIFPDVAVLDGFRVTMHFSSPAGRLKLEDNTLMFTLDNGVVPTLTKEYQTGIHLIHRAIGGTVGEW